MCVSACPYKKIYFNWESGKSEKCTFCYPRIENGDPTVCSETCVGRIRYLGVILYDADRIEEAASVENEEDLYEAQLDIFLNPHDPEVIAQARRDGIPDNWIEGAQKSPIYKMAIDWKVAFPLHPEYRTLPMVWYIPPLSPVQSAAAQGKIPTRADGIMPDLDDMRIPVKYLANLLTGGKEAPIRLGLKRMMAMRHYMRSKMFEGCPDTTLLTETGLTEELVEDMYKIMAIANYEDRYVIPTGHREETLDAAHHLTLLAKNKVGFKNLIKMASVASLEGYYYVPRIDWETLQRHHEGIVCLSGCCSSEFSRTLMGGDTKSPDGKEVLRTARDKAIDIARRYKSLFGDDYYIEIQDNGLDIQKLQLSLAVPVANHRDVDVPLVASCDAHYLTQEDAVPHDVLLCVNTGRKYTDHDRMRYGNDGGKMVDQFYVCAPDEMYARLPGHSEAIRRSQEIADGIDLDLDFKQRYFPVFDPPEKKTPEVYLRELCEQGLAERYAGAEPAGARERLDHELGIICKMGFAAYFLIVWDFCRFAREAGIPCGARGSGVGAITSYLLYLSHVCPIKYDLLFERFLDPNRAEAPDIDIDFCQDRREEVIEYIKRKYGVNSVAQIGTFGTLAAKAALKAVARVFDVSVADANRLSKLIPEKVGTTLDSALADNPDLQAEYNASNEVRALIDTARKLEGNNNNVGTHAAGVVIAAGDIREHVPLMRVAKRNTEGGDEDGGRVTQWDMGVIEKVGLLKMDCLGLRNLTILDNAVRTIGRVRGEWVNVYQLPEGDPDTYALIQRGDTAGVFQFESNGIREMLKRMRPTCLDDLIAANALYRPGPLDGGLVDAYINRKHGREPVPRVHPVYDRVLEKTYGVMVFQESVMQILNQMGGIELAKAYACIKAISKKKEKEINSNEEVFVKGAIERGMDRAVAVDIFDKIKLFAGYGFNRSHSTAYANIAYQTAFLKAHYRPEYTAAMLTSDVSDRDALVAHIDDARRAGVEVLPPDVNVSEYGFTVDRQGRVVFGLSAIKGLGKAAREVVRTRKGVPFTGVRDMLDRVDVRECGKSDVEKLACAENIIRAVAAIGNIVAAAAENNIQACAAGNAVIAFVAV
jgi:DNA polymerase-3 subunit alpha